MMNTGMISADSHVQEPVTLYRERVPERYRGRTPHIVTRDGGRYLLVEGKKPRRLDIAESRLNDEDREREFRSDRSGGTNLALRIPDQARDGLIAEVIYPNQGLALYNSPDPGYQMAVAQAYNDWAFELFGADREHFAPVGIVPMGDIPLALAEAMRLARLGYRSIKIPIIMGKRAYNHPDYEPFWSLIEETGLVLSLHAFANSEDTYPEDWGTEEGRGGALAFMAFSMVEGINPLTLFITSGMLERHPKLRFVIVECDAGWLAWLLNVLDQQVAKKHMWVRPQLALLPSEYFRRQGFATFSDDPVALNNLKFTGADSLMWGSDYPHDEGTFPHSQDVVTRIFAGVSEADRRKIVYGNAARLYGFDTVSPQLTS
jgi:predicted TIM-barrel fold metal-dependent hydrolase